MRHPARVWNNLAGIPGPTLAQGPLGALERLLVPLHCAGCGRADYHLCAACMRDFSGPPQQVEAVAAAGPDGAVRMVPVFSLAPYEGRARRAMLAWKSGTRRDLAPFMDRIGCAAGHALAPGLRARCAAGEEDRHGAGDGTPVGGGVVGDDAPVGGGVPGGTPAGSGVVGGGAGVDAALDGAPALLVVPAPSGVGRRLRGALVVPDFARAVARGVATGWGRPHAPGWEPFGGFREGWGKESGLGDGDGPWPVAREESAPGCREKVLGVLIVDLLALRGASQAGRGKRERGRRDVVARAELPSGWPVLLVDDVLTTGATLSACASAVLGARGRVIAAVTALDAGRGHVITG